MILETIVAGLDLGPLSPPVAKFAKILAGQLKSRLVFVHAEDQAPGPGWEELAFEAERFRTETAEEYAIEGGAEVAWRVGPPAAALQNEVEARGAGFVIAGTGAAGRSPDLGATSRRMMRTLTVPLCLIPTHTEARPLPSKGLRRVLAPIDVHAEPDSSLGIIRELVKRLDCDLTLLAVVTPPKLVAHLSPEHTIALPGLIRELVDDASRRLAHRAMKAELASPAIRVVESDDAAAGILAEAHRLDIDLIVMPSRNKGALERWFIGSTTEKVARLTDRPLMLLPPTWISVHAPH
jgi:nucleotide-binding universal stress UspA family protein